MRIPQWSRCYCFSRAPSREYTDACSRVWALTFLLSLLSRLGEAVFHGTESWLLLTLAMPLCALVAELFLCVMPEVPSQDLEHV